MLLYHTQKEISTVFCRWFIILSYPDARRRGDSRIACKGEGTEALPYTLYPTSMQNRRLIPPFTKTPHLQTRVSVIQ